MVKKAMNETTKEDQEPMQNYWYEEETQFCVRFYPYIL